MTPIKNDPQVVAEYTIHPRPGVILMWPAFLMHYIHPNLSEELHFSISFNLIVKNPTGHLPPQ